MWRITPMHRREVQGSTPEDLPPPLPAGFVDEEVQRLEDGVGPLFHRRYVIRLCDARVAPEELLERITADLDSVAPSEFASFQKLDGGAKEMRAGDEYVVRMPGPWDGPVRVVQAGRSSFRLATLKGHLEAGQIEFRVLRQDELVVFAIESWARSGDRLSDLLYQRLRMAKEIQLHMWTSVLEQVAELSGGRRSGAIDIDTRRVDLTPADR
jgi:hypothetical protein